MVAKTSSAAIRIDGLRQLQVAMRQYPKDVKRAFNAEMQPIAQEVADAVQAQMPEVSGSAKGSVKPSLAGGYVAIRAGGARAPYYPWLDFGGTLTATGGRTNEQHRPFFKEGRWIYPTIARRRPDIYRKALEVVNRWKSVRL